jgi:hypothetical protein
MAKARNVTAVGGLPEASNVLTVAITRRRVCSRTNPTGTPRLSGMGRHWPTQNASPKGS